ncbi:MAG: transcriptional regulator [Bacteroidetes bacterium B1(2017)]|nr:MAG: transcriptional regulator [Bacteroidetes bacterium B1(2017)]
MKATKKAYEFTVEITSTGYSAYNNAYAIATTGKSITHLREAAFEALQLAFEEEEVRISKSKLILTVDLKQFFQYYRVLNAKFIAERVGIHPTLFSQYVQGKKKPSTKQTNKILEGIHEIGKELCELRFN